MRDRISKHPISKGQPTRDTLCWREHNAGYVCLRPEGHNAVEVAVPLESLMAVLSMAAVELHHPCEHKSWTTGGWDCGGIGDHITALHAAVSDRTRDGYAFRHDDDLDPYRTVHAETEHAEMVRYTIAGKWYFESKDGKLRTLCTLHEAAEYAARWVRFSLGRIYLNQPGGRSFERKVRGLLEAGDTHG